MIGLEMRSEVLTAQRWLADGSGVGRAVLVRAVGSSPFEVGSMLLVGDDGRMVGSVSAGCVEGAAVEAVLHARRGRYREIIHFGVTDQRATEVGLSCGGEIDVLVEPVVPEEVIGIMAAGGAAVVASPLPVGREQDTVTRVVLGVDGRLAGSLGHPTWDAELAEQAQIALEQRASTTVRMADRDVFLEVCAPRHLVIVGAGDIAMYLVRLAHAIGFSTAVIDARSAFLTTERFPDADLLLCGWADEEADLARIDRHAYVVALAHDPRFDDPALLVALQRQARYVGALGSRRSHRERLSRLERTGLSASQLARIHAPVGLDLGSHRPADIALGVLAQLVAEDHREQLGADEAVPQPGSRQGSEHRPLG